jgi:hypothetical protein
VYVRRRTEQSKVAPWAMRSATSSLSPRLHAVSTPSACEGLLDIARHVTQDAVEPHLKNKLNLTS